MLILGGKVRQPTERTPDEMVARVQYLLLRRNILIEEMARHLNLSTHVLRQRLTRRSLNDLLPRIAAHFGISEETLLSERLSDDDVLRYIRDARPVQPDRLQGVMLARMAAEDRPIRGASPFGKGKWVLLSTTEPWHTGDHVAYPGPDGYVVRRLGESLDRHVVLFLPHDHGKTERRSKQWATANLVRVLKLCEEV